MKESEAIMENAHFFFFNRNLLELQLFQALAARLCLYNPNHLCPLSFKVIKLKTFKNFPWDVIREACEQIEF